MRIGSERKNIEIEVLEQLPAGDPCAGDVRVLVTLEFQGFRGSHDVWIELPEMERFIHALEVLDAERQGEARMGSVSPDDFVLEIRSLDLSGHMEVLADINRHQVDGSKGRPTRLGGGFEVEPDAVRQLRDFFRGLVSQQR